MNHGIFPAAPTVRKSPLACALALALSATLAGCGGMTSNSSMNSVHQPIVEKVNYTLDLSTGGGGLPYPERERLSAWFDEMGLRYGDRVAVEDPLASPDTFATIETLAARYGLEVARGIPASAGFVEAGTTRIIVTRSKAVVHGCPDWSAHAAANINNGLSTNYGCSVNSNLAAMVANPEHLVKGDGTPSQTTIMSSNKAINSYRTKDPTGSGELKATTSKGD